MAPDRILASWLESQYEEAMRIAQRSSVLTLAPVDGAPPRRYLAKFQCNGLARTEQGVTVIDRHIVMISFPQRYLRTSPDPGQLVTWLEPVNAWHPNVRPPFVCLGHIPPGMSLSSLLYQLYQVITWNRFTPREDDALNKDACAWARANLDRLPIDERRSLLGPARNDAAALEGSTK